MAPQARGAVGLVFMPLGSSTLSSNETGIQYDSELHGAVALEIRSPYAHPFGGARLRLGAELSQHDRIFDVALKYNFLDPLPIQPFITIGIGAANLGPEPGWRATAAVSAGVDLYLTPNLFLTAEIKGRGFADPPADALDAVYGNGVTMATALFGLGAYF